MFNKLNKKGYTLLEITIVMAIFVTLSIVAYDFVISGLKAGIFGYEQDTAITNARRVINSINKQIRGAEQSDRGDYLLDTVATNTLTFFSNIDTQSDIEKISYFIDGLNFKKVIIKPTGTPLEYSNANAVTSTVASYVNNKSVPVFTYYDTNNNIISDPTVNKRHIRLIHIYLRINITPDRAPKDYDIDSDVQIRNLKDNL